MWWQSRRGSPVVDRRKARIAALQESQAEQVLAWDRLEMMSPGAFAARLDELLKRRDGEACEGLDDVGEELPIAAMSREMCQDLISAIAGLVHVYTDYSVQALIDYMDNRGESPDREIVDILKGILINEFGVPPEELANAPDAEVLEMLGEHNRDNPHWSGVLPDAFCVRVWTRPGASGEDESCKSLGTRHVNLFEGVVTYRHLFTVNGRRDRTRERRDVASTYADVKLLIEHDAARFRERSPYYFRFRFSPEDGLWHPIELVHVPTLNDHGPGFYF
jgi:hypothetical protein